jgi:hypothetical protein
MTENAARNFAEKGTAYAKDTLEKSKTAAEQTNKVMEEAYTTASKGAVDFNLHLIEIAQANMNSAFDFARQLTRVTSPTEFFERPPRRGSSSKRSPNKQSSSRPSRKKRPPTPLNHSSPASPKHSTRYSTRAAKSLRFFSTPRLC